MQIFSVAPQLHHITKDKMVELVGITNIYGSLHHQIRCNFHDRNEIRMHHHSIKAVEKYHGLY